jgi:myo-inositol 2-dehydrogenase / D-chiro-inositol 1-dehydrogenase
MNEIKVGIIGCGKQASKHIGSLKRLPKIIPVVSDIDVEVAKTLASKESCDFVKHPDDIYNESGIRAVVICTPTQSHVPLIKQALTKGIHVFCEKPLSDNLSEIEELKPILEDSDSILQLGYVYRYVPVFEEGVRLFRKQAINGESLILGRTLSGFFRLGGRGSHQLWKHKKNSGGGAINEMLVHMIDLASWYFGPLENVEIVSLKLHQPQREIQGETYDVDAEDYILLRCTNSFGAEIFCQADLITPAFSQYAEIQCENGTFRGSIQQDSPSYVFLKEARGGYDAGKTVFSFGQRNLLDIQMTSFIRAVMKNQKPDRNTLEDSIRLMSVIENLRIRIEELK